MKSNLGNLLFQAHMRALKKLNRTPGNLGWVTTHDAYLSKLIGGGILETRRIKSRKYANQILKN